MLIIKTFKSFNYQHLSVGVAGFEPTTPCSQSRCANRTALHPVPNPGTSCEVCPADCGNQCDFGVQI